MVYLYLKQKTDLFSTTDTRKLLHIAPEPCLSAVLRKQLGKSYLTADMTDPQADVQMDICNIQYPDESFDAIICSHVLEHVPDDQKAIREFGRVLKKDGWVILLVPIDAEKTTEVKDIPDPRLRQQTLAIDHVRMYGPDFPDRLRSNNFKVVAVHATDFLSKEEMRYMGIKPDTIFHCTK